MLIPSIDIQKGRAVQLKQGKEFVLEAERSPLELAAEFNRYGEVAVIDLDAALGAGDNLDLVKELCRIAELRCGGGIRSVERGRELLRAGAKQIIIGTAAEPEFLSKFPRERVLVALDQKKGEVFDRGWLNPTGESISERGRRLSPYCAGFLSTFIEEEGGMQGLGADKARALRDELQMPLTVAGGVSSTEEIIEISKLGIDVQVGMALYTGKIDLAASVVEALKYDKDGLCPTIVQDESGQVLMLAYSNKESLTLALQEAKGIYFSRSRQELWEKGLSSGAFQRLISCRVDCDRDSLLFKIKQEKSACHNGTYSCFGGASAARKFSLYELYETLKERKKNAPAGSYSATLFKDRKELLAKIQEESLEVQTFSSTDNLRWEIADLIFMISVLAVDEGIEWSEIEAELGGRKK